jgi:hypothetical protein
LRRSAVLVLALPSLCCWLREINLFSVIFSKSQVQTVNNALLLLFTGKSVLEFNPCTLSSFSDCGILQAVGEKAQTTKQENHSIHYNMILLFHT